MSLTVPIYDLTAKKTGTMKLPAVIFGAKTSDGLTAQAVRVFLANQRRAWSKTKTRSEVKRSGKKIWRQKGTGRARHGDKTAPIFVGGGVAHGPKGTAPRRLKMNKTMRRLALFSGLSWHAKNQNIIILDPTAKFPPKTKKANQLFIKILGKELPSSLLVSCDLPVGFKKAINNLSYLRCFRANQLNVYALLRVKKLIFTPAAIKKIKETFLKQ